MGLKYTIMTDPDNNSIVCINDIRFKGKRKINWDEVEEYLRQYIGEFYENADTKDIIYDLVNIKKETSTPLEP